jgi:hypothetical protein
VDLSDADVQRMPKQIAEKSIRRSMWRLPRVEKLASSIWGERTAGMGLYELERGA